MSFGRDYQQMRERRAEERAANLRNLATVPAHRIHTGSYGPAAMSAPKPKERRLESEEYRAIVRTMPCIHCGISGHTQFCHGDMGKGMGLKTDDRTGWPGCGPHDHKPGCHYLIGTSGTFSKETRRELEAEYARRTRAEILARGLWPKGLPQWEDRSVNANN